MKNSRITQILAKTIDLHKLIKISKDTSLFNFNALTAEDRLELINYDDKVYQPLLGPVSLTDRIYFFLCKNNKDYNKINFTEEEILGMSNGIYVQILEKNFNKFISVKKYNMLSLSAKRKVLNLSPKWISKNIGEFPKPTCEIMRMLSQKFPEIVDQHFTDFSKISTDSYFWIKMIKYNPKYKDIFIKNMDSITLKTDIRRVFYQFPDIFKLLNADIIKNSPLTTKDWTLLFCDIIEENPVTFENWEADKDFIESFEMDLTVEILNGKSTLSRRLQNSKNKLFNKIIKKECESTDI